MKKVKFINRDNLLTGYLFFPENYIESNIYRAVVVVGPSIDSNTQVSFRYASQLSQCGFIALTFDPSFWGKSTGEPRNLEDPATRVEDIKCAADYLMTLPNVDENKVCLLGICAGAGYAVSAAMTDYRFCALATVCPSNIGSVYRKMLGREMLFQTIKEIGIQRTRESKGAKRSYYQWTMHNRQAVNNVDISDTEIHCGLEYDNKPKLNQNSCSNQMLFTSLGQLLTFDSFYMIADMLIQPLQVIVGGREGELESYTYGMELFFMARSKSKDFYVIDDAEHYDFFSESRFIDEAVTKLIIFYDENLNGNEVTFQVG